MACLIILRRSKVSHPRVAIRYVHIVWRIWSFLTNLVAYVSDGWKWRRMLFLCRCFHILQGITCSIILQRMHVSTMGM